jgi:hypothetical protein
VKVCVLSAGLISLHLDALFCGEDHFPHACLDKAFAILLVSLVLIRLSFSIFTMGCHKLGCFFSLFSELVNPFASCVCGKDMSCTLYLNLLCVGMTGLAPCISFIQDYIDA